MLVLVRIAEVADCVPGNQRLNLDAVRANFEVQPLGKAVEEELGCAVHRVARGLDVQTHRTDIDDRPFPAGNHRRQRRPAEADRRHDMDLQHGDMAFRQDGLEQMRRTKARIVDEQIQGRRACDEVNHRILIGDTLQVGHDRRHRHAVARRDVPGHCDQGVVLLVDQAEPVVPRRQTRREGGADTAGGTGDQGPLGLRIDRCHRGSSGS